MVEKRAKGEKVVVAVLQHRTEKLEFNLREKLWSKQTTKMKTRPSKKPSERKGKILSEMESPGSG